MADGKRGAAVYRRCVACPRGLSSRVLTGPTCNTAGANPSYVLAFGHPLYCRYMGLRRSGMCPGWRLARLALRVLRPNSGADSKDPHADQDRNRQDGAIAFYFNMTASGQQKSFATWVFVKFANQRVVEF
jgi:hypothetical protein